MNWELFFFVIGAVIFTVLIFSCGLVCGWKIAFNKALEIEQESRKRYLGQVVTTKAARL